MEICTVHYRTLVNTGNYENRTIGVEAVVGEDESPEQALATAKQWVEQQHAVASGDAEALRRADTAGSYINNLRMHIERAQELAAQALGTLDNTQAGVDQEMPF